MDPGKNVFTARVSCRAVLVMGSAVNLSESFLCIETNLGPFGCLFSLSLSLPEMS